jgi:hypothetical protein
LSTNRDRELDRQRTREVLRGGSRADGSGGRNWLGHTKGAARVDELVVDGTTLAELEEARGGVENHLRHLRVEHDLPVVQCNGLFSFDRRPSAQWQGRCRPRRSRQSLGQWLRHGPRKQRWLLFRLRSGTAPND